MSTRGTKSDHSITVTVYDKEYDGLPITYYVTDYTSQLICCGSTITRYITEDTAEDIFTGEETVTYSTYAISNSTEYFCVNDQWYSSLKGPDDINRHISEPEAAHDILYNESLDDVVCTLIDNIQDMVHGVNQINTVPVYTKFHDIIQTVHAKGISYVEGMFGAPLMFLTGAVTSAGTGALVIEIGRIINSNSTVSLDKQNWYKLETVGQVKTFCSDAHAILTMKQLQES